MTSIGSPSPFLFGGKKAYSVDRSLRFNSDDDTYLNRTPSSASNRKTFTWSGWVKRSDLGAASLFTADNNAGNDYSSLFFNSSDDRIQFNTIASGSVTFVGYTNAMFRDISAWYHIVLAVDTTQGTSSDGLKIYVNGIQQTLSIFAYSQNGGTSFNNNVQQLLGRLQSGSEEFNGYMTEINFIDGYQYDASYFGETNTITGQWVPKKYVGSYGTNGFYLNFSDNSGATATTLGKDSSGNGNNFTPNNFSVSAGTDVHSLEDSPTNNFPTINPLAGYSSNFVATGKGNLFFSLANNHWAISSFTIPASGKWYAECVFTDVQTGDFGVFNPNMINDDSNSFDGRWNGIRLLQSGSISLDNSSVQTGLTAISNGAIVGIKIDRDAGTVSFTINGSANGTAVNISGMVDSSTLAIVNRRNSSSGSAPTGHQNYGQRPFSYLPAGYKALCSANLPDPTIKLPNKHFDTKLYSGTGNSGRTVTGLEFQPDWFWGKSRSAGFQHILFDSVRGTGTSKSLSSNQTNAEGHNSAHSNLTSFDAPTSGANGGVTFGATSSTDILNYSGGNAVGWFWNAGDTDSKTYTVKVVDDSGNKYRFDNFGTSAVTLDLAEGGTYIFNMDDASNASHPFSIGTAANGTVYTSGITYFLDGVSKTYSEYTSGFAAASTRRLHITVPASAPVLYYWCSAHSGMGGQINTNSTLGASNFDGSVQSTVKVNATAGFSITKYTATGSTGATVGHGLGVKPDVIITKRVNNQSNWGVYHSTLGAGKSTFLNTTNAAIDNTTYYNDTEPTSTVFTLGGSNESNGTNGDTYIGYFFSEVAGYSKFGSFVSNGDVSGSFVYLGFRPAWVMLKQSSSSDTAYWFIFDSTRSPKNVIGDEAFAANKNEAEGLTSWGPNTSGSVIDFLSNGFKIRTTSTAGFNVSGETMIYFAFAESPFKNARAR